MSTDLQNPVDPRTYNRGLVKGTVEQFLRPALFLAFVLLLTVPIDEEASTANLKGRRAQEMVSELRTALSIDHEVQIVIVAYHPFVFAVEPTDRRKERFRLSIEIGFLQILEEDELRAAVAHELGHVWIFTHHPFMQTERLANSIGQRVVHRDLFEKLYLKLWAYEGTSGVAMEQLLGPSRDPNASGRGTTP